VVIFLRCHGLVVRVEHARGLRHATLGLQTNQLSTGGHVHAFAASFRAFFLWQMRVMGVALRTARVVLQEHGQRLELTFLWDTEEELRSSGNLGEVDFALASNRFANGGLRVTVLVPGKPFKGVRFKCDCHGRSHRFTTSQAYAQFGSRHGSDLCLG